jgi:hypothetical protein
LAIIPSLINNCSTWIGITTSLEKKLEDLQEQFIRLMLEVPVSTPKAALRAETGMLSMKHRVWLAKLSMVLHLRKSKSLGLAKQIYPEQVTQGWAGLAAETRTICAALGIGDVNTKEVSKNDIIKAVKLHDGGEIREKMERYDKLDKIKVDDPTVAKRYMETKAIRDCRMIFRIRTEMMDLKDNMRNRYRATDTNCEACKAHVPESQAHVMECSAYEEFRVGRDLEEDKEMVAFYRDVLLEREKKKSK